jgi:uncharacterized membrane protein
LNSAQIRKTLRYGRSPSLRRRRAITWLGALALIDSAVMTLFQMGAIPHLPDPPGFDSDRVVGSRAAYFLHAPDAPINALSTSVTLVLAGLEPRRPMFDALLRASVVANAAGALIYLGDVIFRKKRACAYCIPAALFSLAMVPFALPGLLRRSRM